MRRLQRFTQCAAIAAAVVAAPVAAIDSQSLGLVAPLPAQVRQVFSCGRWSDAGGDGYYRVVLAEVNEGAGTEVYLQRIRETMRESNRRIAVVDTTPVRELNDDHAQYAVSAARCIGAGARRLVELVATFEHDEGDVEHRIRVSFAGPGSYRISDTVLKPRRKR